eukprot:328591-Chlamydomonas_euryale.AAC.4
MAVAGLCNFDFRRQRPHVQEMIMDSNGFCNMEARLSWNGTRVQQSQMQTRFKGQGNTQTDLAPVELVPASSMNNLSSPHHGCPQPMHACGKDTGLCAVE